MCKKYINATINCYKSLIKNNDSIVAYSIPFNQIESIRIKESEKTKETENIEVCIKDFYIVTDINILGTNDKTADNPLNKKQTLDVIVRITKCDKIPENQIGKDLASFSISTKDLYEQNQINTACFDFANCKQVITIKELPLPAGTGKYVIKVLIKLSTETDYTIQSMMQLNVI